VKKKPSSIYVKEKKGLLIYYISQYFFTCALTDTHMKELSFLITSGGLHWIVSITCRSAAYYWMTLSYFILIILLTANGPRD